MKKILFVLLLMFNGFILFANDCFFNIGTYGIIPIDKNKSSIRLVDEMLYFYFNKDTYSVVVNYKFYNPGPELTSEVGFPINIYTNQIDYYQKNKNDFITNFKTTVNDKVVTFDTKYCNETNNSNDIIESHRDIKLEKWYIKTVTFSSETVTKVTVSYDSQYSQAGIGSCLAHYYYGSGNTWKNGIEKLTVFITPYNQFVLNIKANCYNKNLNHEWITDDTLKLNIGEVNADVNESFTFSLSDLGTLDYLGMFDNDKSLLNYLNLSLFSKNQLKIYRNAFYAKYNYKFKNSELVKLFSENIYNYKPKYDNVDDKIGSFQKDVIKRIINEEKKR
jgi:hypothetical protein